MKLTREHIKKLNYYLNSSKFNEALDSLDYQKICEEIAIIDIPWVFKYLQDEFNASFIEHDYTILDTIPFDKFAETSYYKNDELTDDGTFQEIVAPLHFFTTIKFLNLCLYYPDEMDKVLGPNFTFDPLYFIDYELNAKSSEFDKNYFALRFFDYADGNVYLIGCPRGDLDAYSASLWNDEMDLQASWLQRFPAPKDKESFLRLGNAIIDKLNNIKLGY